MMKRKEKMTAGSSKFWRFFIPFAVTLISASVFFTTLDYKFRDLFIRTLPSTELRDDVVILAIDDFSIEAVGTFPWSRDILADCAVELKLAGADSVVYDLNYFEKSPEFLSETFLTDEVKHLLPRYIYADKDEYFGSCLKFAGDQYLAFTFSDDGLMLPIKDVRDNATSLGFVNAVIDRDGYLRRLELYKKFGEVEYPQLVLNAVLKKMDANNFEVSRCSVNFESGTENKKVSIPLESHSSVILKYPRKVFEEYNNYSVYNVYRIKLLEDNIISRINSLFAEKVFLYDGENGDADFCDIFESLKYMRDEINYYGKNYTEAEAAEFFAMYKNFLKEFYLYADEMFSSEKEIKILEKYKDDKETADFIKKTFADCRGDIKKVNEARKGVQKKVGNAICIIGTCATSTTDSSLSVYEENFPNVAAHAVLANMILNNDFVKELPVWVCILIAVLLSSCYGLIYLKHNNRFLFASGIFLIIILCAFEFIFFRITRIYIPFAFLFVSVCANFIVLIISGFIFASREKSFLRSSFNRYLSPSVIDQIVRDPSKLNLGGESREMTAIFTDIKSFSTLSEKLFPEELVDLLNIYLSRMSDVILKYGGTIDKFEGDAIIAFFGAPLEMSDHAEKACRAALEIKATEHRLNKELIAAKKIKEPLFTRIGINSGRMVVGNMGTESRMNYTIMGNEVNLAARLEGVNKRYNTHGILLSERTYSLLQNKFVVRKLDRVRVVGMKTPVQLFELLGSVEKESDKMKFFISKWNHALELFNNKKYSDSLKEFMYLKSITKGDGPVQYYIEKCLNFLQSPPEENWDGVFNLSEK